MLVMIHGPGELVPEANLPPGNRKQGIIHGVNLQESLYCLLNAFGREQRVGAVRLEIE